MEPAVIYEPHYFTLKVDGTTFKGHITGDGDLVIPASPNDRLGGRRALEFIERLALREGRKAVNAPDLLRAEAPTPAAPPKALAAPVPPVPGKRGPGRPPKPDELGPDGQPVPRKRRVRNRSKKAG